MGRGLDIERGREVIEMTELEGGEDAVMRSEEGCSAEVVAVIMEPGTGGEGWLTGSVGGGE